MPYISRERDALATGKWCAEDANSKFNPTDTHNHYNANSCHYSLTGSDEYGANDFVGDARTKSADGGNGKIGVTPAYLSAELHADEWYGQYRKHNCTKSEESSDYHEGAPG